MGAKQTKLESIPTLPATQFASSQLVDKNLNIDNATDPRSPTICRTPIYLQNTRTDTKQLAPIEITEHNSNENRLDVLRKRFFRGFSYNLNDPRSPSLHLNRTPLVFEDTVNKSFSLDDTFADLFVESRLPDYSNKTKQLEGIKTEKRECEEDTDIEMPGENKEMKLISNSQEQELVPQTPIALQQEFDPRSPSIGVERTPIVFTDDEVDKNKEDFMLENILATLSLNLNTSDNSSVVSMASGSIKANFNDASEVQMVSKLSNKHLDRVRVGVKSSTKGLNRKPKRRLSRQQIYEDRENDGPTTPKLKISQVDKNDLLKSKRTPLSCVRNRNATHGRSRSVESSAKSIKTRLLLTSFDDNLNTTEHKVQNLRIMQNYSQDSFEF